MAGDTPSNIGLMVWEVFDSSATEWISQTIIVSVVCRVNAFQVLHFVVFL